MFILSCDQIVEIDDMTMAASTVFDLVNNSETTRDILSIISLIVFIFKQLYLKIGMLLKAIERIHSTAGHFELSNLRSRPYNSYDAIPMTQ